MSLFLAPVPDSAKANIVLARAINFYAPGVPDIALPDLQSQIDWIFRHLGAATPTGQQTLTANSATPS